MARTRISTTVDAERLRQARELAQTSDSELMDRALQSLLREMAGARERRSLNEMPYEDDTDLSWVTPAGPSLPYDGDVPQDVQQLASDRRQQYDA